MDDWITDRLPDVQDEYLVTWKTSACEKRFLAICEFEVDEECWIYEGYMNSYPNVEVIAWMPLPNCIRRKYKRR